MKMLQVTQMSWKQLDDKARGEERSSSKPNTGQHVYKLSKTINPKASFPFRNHCKKKIKKSVIVL